MFSFRNGNNTAHNTAMRRKEREKELDELQKKDKRQGRGKVSVEDMGDTASADQSNLSQHILLSDTSQLSRTGTGTGLPRGQDRNQVQDMSQYQVSMQDMGDSNFGFSNLGGESTMGFSHCAAAAYSNSSTGDPVTGGQNQGQGKGQEQRRGQRDVLSDHPRGSAFNGQSNVTATSTSMSESSSVHDRRGATSTVTATGQINQTHSMPPPHAPYLSTAGTFTAPSSSSSSSSAHSSSSSAPPSASTSAHLTPASIAKALSKVPPFARAGLKKQLELQLSQQLLRQLLHGGTGGGPGGGVGSGSGSGGSVSASGSSGDQMQPLNQAERTEMLGNQWESHRQKVCGISYSSLLSVIYSCCH